MSPCDEYKKLVKEWQAARSSENYWRPENRSVHDALPEAARENAENFRKQASRLRSEMEQTSRSATFAKIRENWVYPDREPFLFNAG